MFRSPTPISRLVQQRYLHVKKGGNLAAAQPGVNKKAISKNGENSFVDSAQKERLAFLDNLEKQQRLFQRTKSGQNAAISKVKNVIGGNHHGDGPTRPSSSNSSVSTKEEPFVPRRLLEKQLGSEGGEFRVWNFSAGPAACSDSVMRQAKEEFMNWNGNSGMGFLEMSHRDHGGPVQSTMVSLQDRLGRLLDVNSDTHQILLMPGGAHQQFSGVPLNLIGDGKGEEPLLCYVDTGAWARRAMDHAVKYGKIHIACENNGTLHKPETHWVVPANAKYVHVCLNETVAGLEYLTDPDPKRIPVRDPKDHSKILMNEKTGTPITMHDMGIPLVADATSTLLSRPVKVDNYGVIFASSGKNLGPAGICVVIVKDNLLQLENDPMSLHLEGIRASKSDLRHPSLPQMMDWSLQATSCPIQNIYNTPPTFNMYMSDLVLREYEEVGGLNVVEEKAKRVSDKVYNFLDDIEVHEGFYRPVVGGEAAGKEHRSRMNVCFEIDVGNDEKRRLMERELTAQAAACGIHQLMGHPKYGGLRITLYNSIEEDAVDDALEFLAWFARQYK